MKKASDILILKSAVNFFFVTGNMSQVSLKHRANISLILLSVFVVTVAANYYTIQIIFNQYLTASYHACSQIGNFVTMDIFIILFIKNLFKHEKLWNEIFAMLDKFDFTTKTAEEQLEFCVIFFHIGITVFLFFNVVIHCTAFLNFEDLSNMENLVICIYTLCGNTMKYVYTVQHFGVLNILARRYDCIMAEIQKIYWKCSFSCNKNRPIRLQNILKTSLEKVNTLYGDGFPMMFLKVFFSALGVYHSIFLEKMERSVFYVACYTVHTVLIFVSIDTMLFKFNLSEKI